MSTITLTWDDNNTTEDGHNVYRSTTTIDPQNLPAPLASLGANITSYDDDTVVDDTTYFYRVSAVRGAEEAVSDELEIAAASLPADTGPGPSTLQSGDAANGGYFGEVTAAELFSGDALATEIGLSAGTSQHSTAGWLKFWHEGKVKYIAKRPFRYSISWDAIYAVGAVYGTNDNGSNPTGTATNQYTTVSTGGYNFLVRLLTGANADPVDDTGITDADSCTYDFGGGSEWNELIYRIHQDVPVCPNGLTIDGGPQVGGNWASLTDADIIVGSGNGSRTWAQETVTSNASSRVRLGGSRLSEWYRNLTSTNPASYGWRPLLELL